ncbi:SDR family NAD(P)-dependent oxidoreductase [Lacipirellula parvula]|uniref:3-oxoacyl reductase n=1 Tax=Lacipirellula parvula TaxID=2650471 RepID=A0A5K7XAH9_9BACT|nr:glucose 1-dehydrogenase [Lacipirellula parvula]BBO33724.1 3-oxoacyl reductase [Lacipirellula parvula]
MSSSNRLAGKRILVTGAGTGIGQGIAIRCAREGAKVAVHYYDASDEGARQTVAAIRDLGGEADFAKADLGEISQIRECANWALGYLGGVDVLINNAGITFNSPVAEATPEQWDRMYDVNVRGGYFLTQSLLDSLKQNHGAVINLSSIHAFEGFQEHSIYAGTKGAIVAMTRGMSIELAPLGVRVNAIAPGCVPVPSHERACGKADLVAVGRGIPAGFVGTPDDIAAVAAFLASDDARFIVGQTLVVDGGTTSWMPFGEQFRAPVRAAGVQFGKEYI